MTIIHHVKPKKLFVFLVIVATQIHCADQKYDGLPAPYYTPEQEKAHADTTFNDIIAFNVKNATKEGVTLVTKHGYKLPAKHWSVFYDSLMFYAQEEVHLPPLEQFFKEALETNQVHEQDVDAQLAARLKALGTIQGQSPKKARQLAHEHQ